MNSLLTDMIDNDRYDFYIVKWLEGTYLIRKPSLVLESIGSNIGLKTKDYTVGAFEKLLRTRVDCNISLDNNYSPFQHGMTIKAIDNFQGIPENKYGEFMDKYTELADKSYSNISNIAYYIKPIEDDTNN